MVSKFGYDQSQIRKDDLAEMLRTMRPGEQVDLHDGSLEELWPTPPYPRTDDWLTHIERAKRWCAQFGCDVWERLDPPGLSIAKRRA